MKTIQIIDENNQITTIAINDLSQEYSIQVSMEEEMTLIWRAKNKLITQVKEINGSDNKVEIISMPCCNVGLVVEKDIFLPEVGRIFGLSNVQVVIHITNQELTYQQQLFGPWNFAQSNCFYVVSMQKENGICYKPCILSEDQSGIVPFEESIRLPLHELKRAYQEFPLLDTLNYNLYLKELGDE